MINLPQVNTSESRTYDINQPQDSRGKISETLNPKEIAIMARFVQFAPSNKHLAMMFSCSIKTVKNQLTAIYRVLRVENRSGAMLIWQKVSEQYPPIELNPYWQDSERIINSEPELEKFRLASNQWDSADKPSSDYPPVIDAINEALQGK